jgi:hypothetical protein
MILEDMRYNLGKDFTNPSVVNPAIEVLPCSLDLSLPGFLYKTFIRDQFSSRNQRNSASFFHVKTISVSFSFEYRNSSIETLLFLHVSIT